MDSVKSEDLSNNMMMNSKLRSPVSGGETNTMDSFQDGGQQNNMSGNQTDFPPNMDGPHMNNYPPGGGDTGMGSQGFHSKGDGMNTGQMPSYNNTYNRNMGDQHGGMNMPGNGDFSQGNQFGQYTQQNMRTGFSPNSRAPVPGMPGRPMPGSVNMMPPNYNPGQQRPFMTGQSISQQGGPTPTLNQLLQSNSTSPVQRPYQNNYNDFGGMKGSGGGDMGNAMGPYPGSQQQNWGGSRGMPQQYPGMPANQGFRNQSGGQMFDPGQQQRRGNMPPSYPGNQFGNSQLSPNSHNFPMQQGQNRMGQMGMNQPFNQQQMSSQYTSQQMSYNQQASQQYMQQEPQQQQSYMQQNQPISPQGFSGNRNQPSGNKMAGNSGGGADQPADLPDLAGSLDDLNCDSNSNSSQSQQGTTTPTSAGPHPAVSGLRPPPSPAGSQGSRSNTPHSVTGNQSGSPMPPRPPSNQSQSPMQTQGYNQQPMMPPPQMGGYGNKMHSNMMSGGPQMGGYGQQNSQFQQGNFPRQNMGNFGNQSQNAGYAGNQMGSNQMYGNMGMNRGNMGGHSGYGNNNYPGNNMNMNNQYGGYNSQNSNQGMGPVPPQMQNNMGAGMQGGMGQMQPGPGGPGMKGAQAAAQAALMAAAVTTGRQGYSRQLPNQQQQRMYGSNQMNMNSMNQMPPSSMNQMPFNSNDNMGPPSQQTGMMNNMGHQGMGANQQMGMGNVPNSMGMPNTSMPGMPNTSMPGMPNASMPNTSMSMPSSSMPNSMPNNMPSSNMVNSSTAGSSMPMPNNNHAVSSAMSSMPNSSGSESETKVSVAGASPSSTSVTQSITSPVTTTAESAANDTTSQETTNTSPATQGSVPSMGNQPNSEEDKTKIKTEPAHPPTSTNMVSPSPGVPANMVAPSPGGPANMVSPSPGGPVGMVAPSPGPANMVAPSPGIPNMVAPSPGGASMSSLHDDFENISSPSWPGTPKPGQSNALSSLYELSDEPERKIFLDKLVAFMEEQGRPITNAPNMNKQPLDLYKVYCAVRERGGMLDVTKQKKWKEVSNTINSGASAGAAYTLRKHYMKLLFAFECKFDRGGIDPAPIIQSIEAAVNAKKEKYMKNSNPPSGGSSQNSFDGFHRPPSVHSQSSREAFSPGMGHPGEMNGPTSFPPGHVNMGMMPPNNMPHNNMGSNNMMNNDMVGNNAMMGGESIKCSDPFADDANTNTPSSRMGGPQVPHSYSGANTSYPGYGSSTNTPSYSMNQQSSLPNMMDRFGDGPPPNRVSTQAEQPNEVYRHNQEGFQGNQFGSHGNMNQMSGQHRFDGPGHGPGPMMSNQQQMSSQQGMMPQEQNQMYPNRYGSQMPRPHGNQGEFGPQQMVPNQGQGQFQSGYSSQQHSMQPGMFPGQKPGMQREMFGTPQQKRFPPDGYNMPPGYNQHHQQSSPYVDRSMAGPPDHHRTPTREGQWGNMSQRYAQQHSGYPANANMGQHMPPSSNPNLSHMSPYGPRSMNRQMSPQRDKRDFASPFKMQKPGQLNSQFPPKKELTFPSDSVEATQPLFVKRRKLTAKDIGQVDPWRLMLALKSGLLAESTWALDTLSILLFDDSTVAFFGLHRLPGLLDGLLIHFRRCLNEIFKENFESLEIIDKDKKEEENKQAAVDGAIEQAIADIRARKSISLVQPGNHTMITRHGKTVKVEDSSEGDALDPKLWDVYSNFSSGRTDFKLGKNDVSEHIVTHFEPEVVPDLQRVSFFSERNLERKKELNSRKEEKDSKTSENEENKENCTEVIREESSDLKESNSLCDSDEKYLLSSKDSKDASNINSPNNVKVKTEPSNKEETLKTDESSIKEEPVGEKQNTENGANTEDKRNDVLSNPWDTICRKRKFEDGIEDEPYIRDEPPLCLLSDAHDQLARRCVCISNIFRSLSCIPGNDGHMSRHPGLLVTLGKLLLLHVKNYGGEPRRGKVPRREPGEPDPNEDIVDETQGRNEWWWHCLEALRENVLVIFANIGGQLTLKDYPEEICHPVFDGLLYWAVCPAACANDPMSTMSPNSVLSPKRLVLEALCKMCVHDSNVDLLLATPPYTRIVQLFSTLVKMLADTSELVTREFSLVLLSSLVQSDSSAARVLALQHPSVSLFIDFIETAEQNALNVANTQGIKMLRENPEMMGTSLDMIRRAATVLLHIAHVPENRPLFLHHQERLLNLTMSQILDHHVATILADVLFECSHSDDSS